MEIVSVWSGAVLKKQKKRSTAGKQQDFDADQKRRQQRENDNVPQEPGRADGGNGMGVICGEKVHARKKDVPDTN